jgi:hypothetical protein
MIKKLGEALKKTGTALLRVASFIVGIVIIGAVLQMVFARFQSDKPASTSPAPATPPNMNDPGKLRCQLWVTDGMGPDSPDDGADFAQGEAEEYSDGETWVQGFIAGVSQGTSPSSLTNGPNADQIEKWLEDYCKVHPQETLASAAHSLSAELSSRETPINSN